MNNSKRILAAALALGAASAQATTVDLVTGDTGTANGSLYYWVDASSTGTGVIEPFLRVQNSSGTEQGYNTDLADASGPWETKSGTWTHDLLLSDLVTVTIDGTSYYEFLLDLNETNSKDGRFIDLNSVQIYTRDTAIPALTTTLSDLGTLRYDMDTGADGDVTVAMDYTRNPGSGAGDMLMYVPTSYFAGVAADDYVYFYSLFGIPHEVDAGFEEWALRVCAEDDPSCGGPPAGVPEPGTLSLLGLGLLGLGYGMRRRFQA